MRPSPHIFVIAICHDKLNCCSYIRRTGFENQLLKDAGATDKQQHTNQFVNKRLSNLNIAKVQCDFT